jgi:hypothetical protein
MASAEVLIIVLEHGRHLVFTKVESVDATRMEPAAGRRRDGGGRVSLKKYPLLLSVGIGNRNGGKQGLPRYMTQILSEICFTTERSWAMKR